MSAICRQLPVEVLENIFAQLSSLALFRSVRLVCIRWYLASQLYIVQDVVWNDYRHAKCKYYFPEWKNIEDVVDGLFNVNNNIKLRRTRLVWTSNGNMTTWSKIFFALARLDHEYRAQEAEGRKDSDAVKQPQPSPQPELKKKVVPLTELVLKGEYNFEHRFNLIAPHLKALTSLQLHIHNALEFDLDLELILSQTCPALIRLHIRGGARPIHLLSDSVTQQMRVSREASQVQLKLKSLVLHNIKIDQVRIEHYLSLSPHLLELRLVGLHMTARYDVDWRHSFISHIQQCTFAPHLTSFHLSFTSSGFNVFESLTVADIQELLNFGSDPAGPTPLQTDANALSSSHKSRLSSVTDWGFELHDITPAFRTSLFKIRNLVTSLTLTSNYSCTSSVESGLHDYLCASPQLLHLHTDRIAFQVASMDPYAAQHRHSAAVESGTWNGTPSEYDVLMAPRGIWACRNLKSLHAQFSGYRPLENRWATRYVVHKDMTHAQTRVIFGYLAKVCPSLEELHVVLPPADLGLQSGLCLLSRLKRLERLEVAMSAPIRFWPLERHAWDWMAYRKTRLQAWLRVCELVLWDSEICEEEWKLQKESMELEEQLSQVRLDAGMNCPASDQAGDTPVEAPRLSTSSIESQDSVTNMLMWDDLSEVGKLADVKAALQDLYADWKTPCWPVLEEFKVYGSLDVQTNVQTVVDSQRGWPRAVRSFV